MSQEKVTLGSLVFCRSSGSSSIERVVPHPALIATANAGKGQIKQVVSVGLVRTRGHIGFSARSYYA